jgi:ribose transport system substrate-binding protein
MIRRRRFIGTGLGLLSGVTTPAGYTQPTPPPERPARPGLSLVASSATARNFWDAWWDRGSLNFATSVGREADYKLLENDGDRDLAVKQIETELSARAGNMALSVLAGSPDFTERIAKACFAQKVYFVTQFNKPPDLHPWLMNPYYVAHIANDDVLLGNRMAQALFRAMNYRGGIVALEGSVVDDAARDRLRGLEQMVQENQGITLLDHLSGNWEASAAFEIMLWLLARWGREIEGVWSANDAMALGAIEALRVHGLAGTIPVTGMDADDIALPSLTRGELTATVIIDSFWCGGIGLSLAYRAQTGALNPSTLPPEEREFNSAFRVVTRDNVDAYRTYRDATQIVTSWTDPHNTLDGEIPVVVDRGAARGR